MHDGPRFLIVDDDAFGRSDVRRALASVGHVDEAPNALAALAAVKRGTYDLAVVDSDLPPHLGQDVLDHLREVQPGLNAILLSGAAGQPCAARESAPRNGHYMPESVSLRAGQLSSVVRTALDGERLRVEAQRAHDRLALAVEAARMGTWSFDPQTGEFAGDARFAELIGLPPDGVWSQAAVLAQFDQAERALIGRGLERGDIALQVAVGVTQWVDLRGRRESHAPRNVFGTALDISDQVNETRRSSSLREELLGVASHDLKNPLSAVKQAATLLAKSPNLDERERRFVAHIRTSVERMTSLIAQLLDLTRVRLGGGLQIVRRRVMLDEVLQAVVDELRMGFPERVIQVDAVHEGIDVDPDRFEQVASNLIGNALKYSLPESTVSVTLSSDAHQTVFSVQSFGVTISPEAQLRIFEPFVQVGPLSGRDGLGLGLHISREIVRAHGGTVTVSSSAAAGSRFTVRLPKPATPFA